MRAKHDIEGKIKEDYERRKPGIGRAMREAKKRARDR
jgi:hypothetical protein